MKRLPAPWGHYLDRSSNISFTFNGNPIAAHHGDTLVSAISAADRKILSRSFKYHRPRGLLTLTDQDAGTLVTIPGMPNSFAGETPAEDGLEVTSQNHLGSLEFDLGRITELFSSFLPVGFYYKTFYWPRGIWQYWARLFRRSAGLGKIQTSRSLRSHKSFIHAEHLIIGAGKSGLQCAIKSAEAGANVLLIEREPLAGGRSMLTRETAEILELIRLVEAHPQIRLMTGTIANGWFADHQVTAIAGDLVLKIRATRTTLATGAITQPLVFRNNDLPGVMLTSAAERLLHFYGVLPGERAVIMTSDGTGDKLARDIIAAGGTIAAIIDLQGSIKAPNAKILTDVKPVQAVAKKGCLSALQIRHEDGSRQTIDCDLLCMSGGTLPTFQLACQAGARLSFADNKIRLTDLPAGMEHCGQAGEKHAVNPLVFPHPDGKDFVDLDEDLTVHDISNAIADGFEHVQLIKRYSTVGMGPSQGRHSSLATAEVTANVRNISLEETGITTARPPLTAEPIALSAGETWHQYRLSAMHDQHIQLKAELLQAGQWLRPAFYPRDGETREDAICREMITVRNSAGLIDVSTLGGIDLRGPDAGELLNRLYTSGFKGLAIGKLKYALMTNEAGVVIDDGVAARLTEQHYYVTATTTGVDQVYRQMLKWNVQWKLDVDITNCTSAIAAVNIAGPESRKILSAVTEVDLSQAAFPYLGAVAGSVAGIPARILRLGFVGELGYEIHVPRTYGNALWQALMDVPGNLTPFGVETQRLLRLEKGHIIIGQDTDAMSNLYELGLQTTIAQKKPFFLGKRTSEELGRKPLMRQLNGFSIDSADLNLVPEESCLVLDDGKISGRVTSACYSPTLNKIIGLAYTTPEATTITIKLADGRRISANVVSPHFYDPGAERQIIDDEIASEQTPLPPVPVWPMPSSKLSSDSLSIQIRCFEPRAGLRGQLAADHLVKLGYKVPAKPNTATIDENGITVARLSNLEFLILGKVLDGKDSHGVYHLPRDNSHLWLTISGVESRSALQRICAIDLRPASFQSGDVAQTIVFSQSVILVSGSNEYHLLFDSSISQSMYNTLREACQVTTKSQPRIFRHDPPPSC